ncbi:MAG: TolC family protein [Bacteroidales bacterium]|nr:TolC family protein [Bacteroidales bacterium]
MKTLYLYITLFLISFSSFAQDSLLNYLEIAANNNPALLQKFNEYQAALQKVPQVGSLPDPELSIGVFLKPMELIGGNQVADIRLMQMFPWFGVLKNAKDEMSLMAKAKFESFRDAKLQVFYDIQRTWNELQKVEQDIRISEKNVEILRTIERLAIVKFKAISTGASGSSSLSSSISSNNSQGASSNSSGMNSMGGGSGNTLNSNSLQQPSSMQSSSMGSQAGGSGLADLYRIQMEIGELDNNISLLKNQQSTIVARFNAYLNRPVKSTVTIPKTLIADSLVTSIESVSDSMLVNNPMLVMLNFEKQSLDARQKMVTQMGYPMVGLGLNYSLINKNPMSTSSMNGKDMIMPMVTVTLPIYRKKYNAMKSEANLLKTASEENYQATVNALQVEYYQAIQLYQDAERRIKLYENQSQLAHKTLDIMIKSFSASGSGLSDILRIRQLVLDYETRKVEAITDFNTSIAWLNRLMASSQGK